MLAVTVLTLANAIQFVTKAAVIVKVLQSNFASIVNFSEMPNDGCSQSIFKIRFLYSLVHLYCTYEECRGNSYRRQQSVPVFRKFEIDDFRRRI